MQQAKISTVVVCLAVAVLLGTTVDALLNLGDTFKGEILVDDEDIVEFEGLAGERVTVSMKADKGQSLLPELAITDPDDAEIASDASGKNKSTIKKLELPATGIYQIHMTGAEATIGTYTTKTKGKLTKAIKSFKNDAGVGPEDSQDTSFDAKTGYLLNGTINGIKKSEAVPFNPMLMGPTDPVELTGFITKNKKGNFKIKDLVLPELGTYTLSVENSGLSGIVKTKLKIKAPKVKKQTIVEESEF